MITNDHPVQRVVSTQKPRIMKRILLLAWMTLLVANAFAQVTEGYENVMQRFSIEDSINWGNITQQQVDQIAGMAAKGHSNSLYYLGRCYFNGYGVKKDRLKAVECYSQAAEKDNTEALYYLGFCYKYGYGVTKNETKAEQFFGRSVKWLNEELDNRSYAPYYLALCYNYGFGVDMDHEKSVELYHKAAIMGNSQALVSLAVEYQMGNNNFKKDPQKAVEYFQKAAEWGNPQAQLHLGYCYLDGEGVGKDTEKAREYFRMAAAQGLPKAEEALAK